VLNTLEVSLGTAFDGRLDIQDSLRVVGTMEVSGASSMVSLNVADLATISSLDVTGASTLHAMAVETTARFNSLSASNNVDVSSTLSAADVEFNGRTAISGHAAVGSTLSASTSVADSSELTSGSLEAANLFVSGSFHLAAVDCRSANVDKAVASTSRLEGTLSASDVTVASLEVVGASTSSSVTVS